MGQILKNLSLIIFIAILLSGCSSTKFSVMPSTRIINESGFLQVGASQLNITPYPGFPMGGYGSGGKIARGKWKDLFVKATYLQDARGERLAIVSCDLWSVPLGLSLRVCEILSNDKEQIYHLGSDQLLLCATHTHNSQAGFSTSEAYNALASPISGFDEKMFNHLAATIARTIKNAIDHKTSAEGAISYANIEGFIRNRSIVAFNNIDPKVQMEIKSGVNHADHYFENPDLPAFINDKSEFEAVDPIVTTVIFTPVNNTVATPIAIVNFLSMHPTVLGHDTEVYSADVFGVSESIIKKKTGFYPTVISFINGTEGDISPNWVAQDYKNVIEIGDGIAGKILNGLFKAKPLIYRKDSLRLKYNLVNIKDARVNVPLRGITPPCFSEIPSRTALHPYPGIATIGGAEDGRTLLYSQGMHEGISASDCIPGQGNKINAISSAVELTFAPLPGILKGIIGSSFKSMIEKTAPKILPLGVYSIGNLTIASVPGEPTTALGYYIKESIKKSAETYADDKIVIAGLANEYLSYFTTPAEYGAQQYEGASTMYGVHAGSFLEQELEKMGKSKQPGHTIREVKMKTGKSKEIFQGHVFNPYWNKSEGLANFYISLTSGKPINDFLTISYKIPTPDNQKRYSFEYPRISIEKYNPISEKYIEITDDLKGTDLITILHESKNGTDYWHTIWLCDSCIEEEPMHRIKLTHPTITEIISVDIKFSEHDLSLPFKIN